MFYLVLQEVRLLSCFGVFSWFVGLVVLVCSWISVFGGVCWFLVLVFREVIFFSFQQYNSDRCGKHRRHYRKKKYL